MEVPSGDAGSVRAFAPERIDVEEGVYLVEQGKAKNTPPEIRPRFSRIPAVFLIETNVSVMPDAKGNFADAARA